MSGRIRIYRNEDVHRVLAFIPPNHRHIRLAIEFRDQIIVVSEAVVAAIVRAYIDIATHPTRKAVELTQTLASERKPGYAKNQLVETGEDESRIIERGLELLKNLDEVQQL